MPLKIVWQGKSFLSLFWKVHFVSLQIWKGQNEVGNCDSRKRNQFSYANIDNKRSHFASFSWILITQSFSVSFSFSVQPSACVRSRKFYTGTFDRCEGFLASYAVYKHYCIKICFAKGKHYLWKEFSFHGEDSSISGIIYRISIIWRYITQISKAHYWICARFPFSWQEQLRIPCKNNFIQRTETGTKNSLR